MVQPRVTEVKCEQNFERGKRCGWTLRVFWKFLRNQTGVASLAWKVKQAMLVLKPERTNPVKRNRGSLETWSRKRSSLFRRLEHRCCSVLHFKTLKFSNWSKATWSKNFKFEPGTGTIFKLTPRSSLSSVSLTKAPGTVSFISATVWHLKNPKKSARLKQKRNLND